MKNKFNVLNILKLSILLSVSSIEMLEAQTIEKKHGVSICSVFNNESRDIEEFLVYHINLGVDHFYLYDNGSTDSSLKIVQPYIDQGIVTYIPWLQKSLNDFSEKDTWALSIQIPAYEHAIQVYGIQETEWMLCLDVNERLDVKQGSLLNLVKNHHEAAGLVLGVDCFDASIGDEIPPHELVIQSHHLTALEDNPQIHIEKTVFKPEKYQAFTWAPYRYLYKNHAKPVSISKREMRINRYLHRHEINFGKRKANIELDTGTIDDSTVQELLNEGYTIEEQGDSITKFVPDLLKLLKKI